MIIRLVALIVIVGFAYLVVAVAERRTRRTIVDLPPGITVVTGPECQLCASVISGLRERDISPNVVDIEQAPASLGTIRGLPHAVVVNDDGEVTMRRSGRSALTDVDNLAQRAKQPA